MYLNDTITPAHPAYSVGLGRVQTSGIHFLFFIGDELTFDISDLMLHVTTGILKIPPLIAT